MFQPQPTPFASACFASTPYAFPPQPPPPPSTSAALSNPNDPSRVAALPYGLLVPGLDLGFHIPSGAGSEPGAAAAGASSGAGPGLGATGIGATGGLYTSTQQTLAHRRAPPPPQHRQQQQPRSLHVASQSLRTAAPLIKMEDSDPHGIAAQQAAAKDYQPNLEGPLVGEKTTTSVITQEYEKADAAFVEKTYNLPQTFAHYRPIQGDGNCGWRAIGFSYYEKLVETGSRDQIEGELTRLRGYNQLLVSFGYDYWEDFADEALGLLQEISGHMSNPTVAQQIVYHRWNDPAATQNMMYYFRLLSSLFLKMNAGQYDPFIADAGGIPAYCSTAIELPNKEIEHLGILALSNVLLKPINVVLEILYLDRSPGPHATTYRFPEEANSQDESQLGTVVYLLFRPTHYDILYKAPPRPPVEAPSQPVSIQVHRVNTFDPSNNFMNTHTDLGAFATADFSMMGIIPGFGPPATAMPLGSPVAAPLGEPFSPTPQGQSYYCDGLTTTPSPQSTVQQPPIVPPPAASLVKPSTPLSPHSAAEVAVQRPTIMPAPPLIQASPECTIRFSQMQLEYDGSKGNYPEPTFQVQTSTFKNSVWNRAHFGNPDFHPEEWSPEDENVDGRVGSRKKSR